MSGKIYNVVDESFINNFHVKHRFFMKDLYYEKYANYCNKIMRKPLEKELFFRNMRRKKIKLVQVCCPYCGNMDIMVMDEKIDVIEAMKYCYHCGKTSASKNAQFQLSSIIRMRYIDNIGVAQVAEKHPNDDIALLSYEVYHHELILLSSILEIILRDFFETLIYLKYMGRKSNYISNVIRKSTGNDFMNFDKANEHYKKALEINLKEYISADCRRDLIDMVNIRNTLVHNNGMADKKFKDSDTYLRISNNMKGNLIFLTPKEIDFYYLKVAEVCDAVIDIFERSYANQKYQLIASHFFNKID